MSDIKVNGNTYTGVESVRFMKADDSGYATYTEGTGDADTLMGKLIARESMGDIEREDATPCLDWMSGYVWGTISFPYATALKGGCERITAENVLLPNISTVTPTSCGKSGWCPYGFINCKITGTLDLSSLATVQNNAVKFTTSEIGTLKLGSYLPNANLWAGCTITNAILKGLTADWIANQINPWHYLVGATITNLYVPADAVDTVQAAISDGSLDKITNLYSIDDWED